MEERKISLNILGCCVLRDTFGMHPDDGGYVVNRYVQIPSPISLVTGSPLLRKDAEIEDTVFEGKSGFVKRCQLLELKKQVFDYLGGGIFGLSDNRLRRSQKKCALFSRYGRVVYGKPQRLIGKIYRKRSAA